MTNTTVIIPIHELSDLSKNFLNNAIKSVKEQRVTPEELLIVTKNDEVIIDYLKSIKINDLNIRILINEGNTDFSQQINYAVNNITTEWTSCNR